MKRKLILNWRSPVTVAQLSMRPLPRRQPRWVPGSSVLKIMLLLPALNACASDGKLETAFSVSSSAGASLTATPLADFDSPWAMTFLPEGQLLVTEKGGQLWLLSSGVAFDSNAANDASNESDQAGELQVTKQQVGGLPSISAQGQGGLGDIITHPDFANNQRLYISFVEREQGRSGAVVASAILDTDSTPLELSDLQIIWRQNPKVKGEGHYGHRLAFSADGFLFVTSGERQKFDPAQDMSQNLGKVIRLNDDGSVPDDNPFSQMGGLAREFFSLGHRNPLGIAFDRSGQLWVHEMGPRGGDELNLVIAGANYGYPIVSNGRHYSGINIPDHDTRPEFNAPAISWSPVISPSGLVIYSGDRYPGWKGTALIGGLSSQSLVRVKLGQPAIELERFEMGKRIREVEQGPDGLVYLLEDRSGGRLLRLEVL
ncbi:MAG: PQQ-dependent sugar dehydrogenase [Granulosicoccus sp.]